MEKSQDTHRWWDWISLALHFFLLETVASRLVTTNWTPFLFLTQTVTYIAYIIGTAMGYSRFSRRTSQWLTFFYMVLMLPLQWTLIIDQKASLEEQLTSVAGRLFFSTQDFMARRAVDDPIFFVVIMSILFWYMSSWTGFTLVRNQNYLGAVLPPAIGLLIIQNYDSAFPSRLWFVAFFTLLALFLLGRLHFLQNQKSWRERRVFLSPDNRVELTSGMAVTAGLIILVAWTVPASLSSLNSAVKTWNKLTEPWRNFTQDMESAVSALDTPSGGKSGEFFGSELPLGRGFPLSDSVMFEVKVPDVPFDQKPPRYYWRGRVYDYFINGQWYTTGTTREDYDPSTTENVGVSETATPSRFVFNTGRLTFSLLYSPAQPVWFSRSGIIFSSPAGDAKDVVAWHSYPALRGGETYQVEAVLNNPNIQQLKEAGTDYPEWVTSKYLQMPPEFSPSIQQLASEITADAATPYDKAVAITSYLRKNIKYAETVPQVPRNTDPLEWILFEHKEAFCVYYASSEIMMLRSLGIPARMAVGFAQGERVVSGETIIGSARAEDEGISADKYVVRKLNAHAWPEVYFPNIGWVEFEPTGNQLPLDRPLPPRDPNDVIGAFPPDSLHQEDSFDQRDQSPLDDQALPPAQQDLRFLPILYLVPLLVVTALLIFFLNRRYPLSQHVPVLVRATMERAGMHTPRWVLHWEYWGGMSAIEKAFESINFGLRSLRQPAPIHSTPIERAQTLTHILPRVAPEIKLLLDEHQTSLYTSRVGNVTQARQAALNIRKQVIVEWLRYLVTGKLR
jgi:transglutaminase-like putative cysteine protease